VSFNKVLEPIIDDDNRLFCKIIYYDEEKSNIEMNKMKKKEK
jgi:hypothetical protein